MSFPFDQYSARKVKVVPHMTLHSSSISHRLKIMGLHCLSFHQFSLADNLCNQHTQVSSQVAIVCSMEPMTQLVTTSVVWFRFVCQFQFLGGYQVPGPFMLNFENESSIIRTGTSLRIRTGTGN